MRARPSWSRWVSRVRRVDAPVESLSHTLQSWASEVARRLAPLRQIFP